MWCERIPKQINFQTSLEREAIESDSLVEKICMEIAHKE